ncbi:hypothetical protein CAP35_08825 [Chitinophagaceae bacterium IBVUCB1]|nr:hypothetical protein CAP35_08825 [Chitinophagaceae bacterium IBVUCB1]
MLNRFGKSNILTETKIWYITKAALHLLLQIKSRILIAYINKLRMRYIILMCMWLCMATNVCTGSAYYDAITIRNMLPHRITTDNARFGHGQAFLPAANVLAMYMQDVEWLTTNTDDVIKAYQQNPFIAPMLPAPGDAVTIEPNTAAGPPPAIPSLDVTNIADGLARFLIKRGKQELNVAFFSQMKKTLNKYPECTTLFPTTTAMLNTIETYRYAELLQTLQAAFNKDLTQIIPNLNNTVNLPRYQPLLKELPAIRTAIRYASIISQLAQTDKPIYTADLINSIVSMDELADNEPELNNAFRALRIISASLRSNNDRQWITIKEMGEILKDDISLRLFLGLVYEQVKDIHFSCNGSTITMGDYMKRLTDNPYAIATLFENFVWMANEADELLKEMQRTKEINAGLFTAYITKSSDIIRYASTIVQSVQPCTDGYPYLQMADNAIQLFVHSCTHNYNNAVLNLYNITSIAFGKQQTLAKQKAAQLRTAGKPVSQQLQQLCDTKPDASIDKALAAILKYGNFIATAAKAQTPEEVEAAIETTALPVGSYSIKQKAIYNITVNAYAGYSWNYNSTGLYMRGVYAPIGIGFNTAISKRYSGAIGIYASLIDIGGIVAYRLENGNTQNMQQQVRLESILAPGAQLAIGIPKLPISIVAGWRMTPKLFYKDNVTTTTVLPQNVLSTGILVDIPLFNIANKTLR